MGGLLLVLLEVLSIKGFSVENVGKGFCTEAADMVCPSCLTINTQVIQFADDQKSWFSEFDKADKQGKGGGGRAFFRAHCA